MSADEYADRLHADLGFKPPEQWQEVIRAAVRAAVSDERETCARQCDVTAGAMQAAMAELHASDPMRRILKADQALAEGIGAAIRNRSRR